MADEAKPLADVTTTPEQSAKTETEVAVSTDGAAAEVKVEGSEVKPDAEKPQGEEKVVPEKYELKLPEGSLLDQTAIDRIAQIAKEHKLSNEEAQGELEREHEAVASFVEGQQAAFQKQTQAWFETCQNDKDVGGVAFKENAEIAKRAIEHFFDGETKKILNETGWGNHPDLFKGFVKLGRMLSDDKLVMPQSQGGGQRSKAEILYGEKS
jgi:hypothetical protein